MMRGTTMQIIGWLRANGMPSAAAGILSTIRSCKHHEGHQHTVMVKSAALAFIPAG